MLISCKTGNNTGHAYNLLRGKLATASANEGKFSAQKDLSQKAPFGKTDNKKHILAEQSQTPAISKKVCSWSNASTVPHHLFPVPQPERTIPVGQLV